MTILCYHSVQEHWQSPLAIKPDVWARHARWLAARRSVLPLDAAVKRLDSSGRLPRGTTAVTFDDGFAALYDHVLPVLTREQMPATVFLVAETLTPAGRVVDWVDTPPPFPLATLSRDQVLEMQDAGVAFASHSYSHHDLTTLSYDQCVKDLRDSRDLLEEMLGRPVPLLAYPRGRNNDAVRKAAAQAGYSYSFTLPVEREPVGPHGIPRVGIFPGNGERALAIKTRRAYVSLRTSPAFPVLRRALRRNAPATTEVPSGE